MSRIRRGWALTSKSWGILRSHPQLVRLPVFGALASLPFLAMAVAGLYLIDTHDTAPGVALLIPGLYLATFVSIFFNVALAAAADAIFAGRTASAGFGIGVARQRLAQIAGWALVATVVGSAIRLLENQRGIGEAIVGTLVGVAWSLATFLAIPVIALEGAGPLAALKRSTSLFRSRWPGQVGGNIAIGGLAFLLGILPGFILLAGGIVLWSIDGNRAEIALGAVLASIGLVLFAVTSLLAQAVRQVFGVALYRFADAGGAVGGFSEDELESAVRSRGH